MNLLRKRFLAAVIFLALSALVVWIATRDRASVTMGSGAVITLYEVTYGKEHRIVYGSLWQRLRSRLPQKWFGPSGGLRVRHSTTNDSVVAWLVWKGKPETLMRNVPNYVVMNDRGQTVSIVESAGIQVGSGTTLVDGRPLVLPRQGKTVRLRLYELDANSKSVCRGEFKLSVPSLRDAPSWRPEPLPIRRMDESVEFTLTRFTADHEVRPERGFATALNTLTFQIAEQGQHSTNWQLRSIRASDALGNHNFYRVSSFPDRNGDETWTGSWLLWPDEPAWKLHLEFARRSGFAPTELWHVRGIPAPGSYSFMPGSFQTNLQGVSLRVRGISDAQGLLADGTMSVNATSNVLDLTWAPSPPGLQVALLEVKDEHGQNIKVNGSAGGDHGTVGYGLNIAGHIRSLDALFAVRRSRSIEVVAKPEMEATNRPTLTREK